jgi:hypothetical protein
MGSFVYASNEWDDRQIQEALRQAFTQWGLCNRFQTDRETQLVNTGDHPFPKGLQRRPGYPPPVQGAKLFNNSGRKMSTE